AYRRLRARADRSRNQGYLPTSAWRGRLMSHTTTGTILNSLLDTFDPESEHYQGVRDHFSAGKLARIDALRALPDNHHFTFDELNFIAWALTSVVFKAAKPPDVE